MKNSEILKVARGRIEREEETFVCVAIGRMAECNQDELKLRGWVVGLIAPHYTLDCWIEEELGISVDGCGPGAVDAHRMRITRLAWIDWMIEYWEGEGQ